MGRRRRRTSGGRRAEEVAAAAAASEATIIGDDAATLARAAQWRSENPDLAVRQAEFFHSLWDVDPGGAVAKEELLALGLSPDYRQAGMSVAYATATTCCAVGARAVGTRRGDGPSRGLASKADGWGRLAARDGAGPEGGWGNKWWVRWRGASASSEVPLRR